MFVTELGSWDVGLVTPALDAKCGAVLERKQQHLWSAITQWVGYVVRRGSNAEVPVLCLITAKGLNGLLPSHIRAENLEPPQNGEVIMHLAESSPPEQIFKITKIAGVDAACASRWMTIDGGCSNRSHYWTHILMWTWSFTPDSTPQTQNHTQP